VDSDSFISHGKYVEARTGLVEAQNKNNPEQNNKKYLFS